MREGAGDTAACLGKAIVDEKTEARFDPQVVLWKRRRGSAVPATLMRPLAMASTIATKAERPTADRNLPKPNLEYAKLLERMLRDMLDVRAEYEIKP